MRKLILFIMAFCTVVLTTSNATMYAEDFSDREDEMNSKCAIITDSETQQECIKYKEYLDQKWTNLDEEIANIEGEITKVQGNMEKLEKEISQNKTQLETLSKNIKSTTEAIEKSQKRIEVLRVQIDEKTLDIIDRDQNMKERLKELQPYTSTNQYIEFIMGAKSFADLLRRSEIISELSNYESLQIEILSEEREVLSLDKSNYETQRELLQSQKLNLENDKAKEEKLMKLNEKLIGEYRKQEDELYEEKVMLQLQQTQIPDIDTTLIAQSNPNSGIQNFEDLGNMETSHSFIKPIKGDEYVYSAGTWAYPLGGLHRGVDFGTFGQGKEVVAPANGIVVWVYEGCPSPDGNNYPNSCGIPLGGGNNLLFVCEVDGIAYAMPMYHLKNVLVNEGQVVTQGQTLGLSGNSGNSTGPHLHIEIIKIGEMSLDTAVLKFNSSKDFTFGAGWGIDPKPCGDAPCRLRPEIYWVK